MDINVLIARRVRTLRDAQGLSLAALAELSGVSRSNISLIERGESSPTATVLDRLSAALGITLAALFDQPADAPSPVSRVADQVSWTDPVSGYVRRTLSPAADPALQLVEVQFPPGQRVAYDTSTREHDVHQQVWMIEGGMEITVGNERWTLAAGDCLAMRLDRPITFHNTSSQPARYLVALSTSTMSSRRPV